ncbi:MAG TPA: hypothetical protein VHR55_08515 [Candidatus Limnocylindria bacterium]|nr:hypothetical protein [Candidatus Limnocylindria bacterium]
MSGLGGTGGWDVVATWVAAAATIVVLGGMFGERRLFGWSQHLLAGLATGFLALVVISEVIVPRVVEPLAADPTGRPELWAGLLLVGLAAGAPWLPRPVASIPIGITIGALAAFAFGGAIIGTLLPQLVATTAVREPTATETVVAAVAALVTVLVVLSFLHGTPRDRIGRGAHRLGRWLLVAGLGGWFGYLVLSRLVLLVDRVGFLLGDWLGIGR